VFRAFRISLALGIATAAIAAASVVPAYAATLQPVTYPQFVPDVTVFDVGQEDYSATVTHFKWQVMNIGKGPSGPITVDATCQGNLIQGVPVVYHHQFAGLQPGEYTFVTYNCAGGYKNTVGSHIHVSTANDSNRSNDYAFEDNDPDDN
jgi:hypothetical protein